jgi:hypothetical protein
MATPTGPRATAARNWFARERRRSKQDQKDFDLAGFEAAPFRIIALAVNVGGGGYNVGDEFLISGGTFSIQGRGYVVSEAAGAVTAVAIQIAGAYTVTPGVGAATVAQTGGGNDLLTVDVTLSALFDFGAVAAGGSSANVLTLPASLEIALQINAATTAGDLGVLDTTDAIDYVSAEAGISGGRVNIRKRFKEAHAIRITRAAGAPAGAVLVFFRGPKSQLVQFGQATFT